jgi:hypothetical protein
MNDSNETRTRKSRATLRAERYLPDKVHFKFLSIRDPATSPLSWRAALLFSYLAHRARVEEGCSRREVERVTGLKRESLTSIISTLGVGGLVEERDGKLHAVRPLDDSLFHLRKGEARHWSDRYAYFRFYPCQDVMPAHALVYSRLLAMDEGRVSRSLLAGRLGMARQTVGRAFEALESRGMLSVRDFATGEGYSRFRLPEPTPEARAMFPDVRARPAPKPEPGRGDGVDNMPDDDLPEDFRRLCTRAGFPRCHWEGLLGERDRVGRDRFWEVFTRAYEDHEANIDKDPGRYNGSCVGLLLHRLGDVGTAPWRR